MFLSLIWMVLLRFCAGIMAWAVVLSVNILCAVCTILAFLKVTSRLMQGSITAFLDGFCQAVYAGM